MGRMTSLLTRAMAHPEVESLIAELKAWCKAQRGRNLEIATMLEVSPQLVSDWLSRRADPRLEEFFKLRDFLKAQRRKRKPKDRPGPE